MSISLLFLAYPEKGKKKRPTVMTNSTRGAPQHISLSREAEWRKSIVFVIFERYTAKDVCAIPLSIILPEELKISL